MRSASWTSNCYAYRRAFRRPFLDKQKLCQVWPFKLKYTVQGCVLSLVKGTSLSFLQEAPDQMLLKQILHMLEAQNAKIEAQDARIEVQDRKIVDLQQRVKIFERASEEGNHNARFCKGYHQPTLPTSEL